MKPVRFFSAALIVAITGIMLTACGNKPPFERLAAAVDSVNAYYGEQPDMTAPGADLVYDEVSNTVKIVYNLPSEQVADFFKENIGVAEDILLKDVLPEAPYSLMKEMAEAEANAMIVYDWKPKGHAEYLIESGRIKEAWKAVGKDAPGK